MTSEFTNSDNPFNDPELDQVFLWTRKGKSMGWNKFFNYRTYIGLIYENNKKLHNFMTSEFTNSDNPFNDPELDQVFLWKRKGKSMGWTKFETKERALDLKRKNFGEILAAKQRRRDREEELLRRSEEREKEQRIKESASYAGWERREEEFMLKQHREACAIRINQGRETPGDAIARDVLLVRQMKYGPEVGPDGKQVNVLAGDVGVQAEAPLGVIDMLILGDLPLLRDELVKHKMCEPPRSEYLPYWDALLVVLDDVAAPPPVVLPRVVCDSLRESCENKTIEEIRKERQNAAKNLAVTAKNSEDSRFYFELEKRLQVEEYRALIRAMHNEMVQIAKSRGRHVHAVRSDGNAAAQVFLPRSVTHQQSDDENGEGEDQMENAFEDVVELPVNSSLIKPRFWNRVRSGYEWNKYNRAHFDRDNPPPKSIFGYRFNILYPNLGKVPTYKLEADKTDPAHFCVIRFTASTPYADIAFRIENREWDRGGAAGFKNSFENGILQLHFNYVRKRYRR